METNVIGYLLLLSNLQSFTKEIGPIKDVVVEIGHVKTMLEQIKNMPEYPIESFRKNGLSKGKEVSVFVSKSFRNYVFNHGNPNDEGILIKLIHDKTAPPIDVNNKAYLFNSELINDSTKRKVDEIVRKLSRRKRHET